jgi:hypothetical protein
MKYSLRDTIGNPRALHPIIIIALIMRVNLFVWMSLHWSVPCLYIFYALLLIQLLGHNKNSVTVSSMN